MSSFRAQGLVIAGFPANDFKQQEPGTNQEILSFCQLNYGVTFPLFAKITVAGPHKHPLYALLIDAQPTATTFRNPAARKAQSPRHRNAARARDRVELREVPRQPQRRSGAAILARHEARCSRADRGHRNRTGQLVAVFRRGSTRAQPSVVGHLQGNFS